MSQNLRKNEMCKVLQTLLCALVFLLISAPSFAVPTNFIAARVNNKAITNSEVDDRYRFVLRASKIKIKNAYDQKILREQVIDKMVDEELIRQEAENLKFEVTPAEMKEALEILALQRKQNSTQLKVFFINNGLSFENYLKQVESEILWSKIVSETLRSKVKVTDVEVKELFEQNKFSIDVRKFRIAEIVISNSSNAAQFANKLADELRQGADFKNLVQQFSSAVSSENYGEIGWVSQSDIDPKIYAAISKLKKGGYSDSVQLGDGYHIFKLLDAKTEIKIHEKDLATAKNIIFNNKLQTLSKGYLMDLRKKAFVEVS